MNIIFTIDVIHYIKKKILLMENISLVNANEVEFAIIEQIELENIDHHNVNPVNRKLKRINCDMVPLNTEKTEDGVKDQSKIREKRLREAEQCAVRVSADVARNSITAMMVGHQQSATMYASLQAILTEV